MSSLALQIASQVGRSPVPSALHQAVQLARGGAVVAVAQSAAHILRAGGAKQNKKKVQRGLTPEAKAVVYMATAMAFHYLGYSLARPITLTFFSSSSTGYGGNEAAFPFAMAFVSPLSLLMLMGYGNILEKWGPWGALCQSTLFCALTISLSAVAIALLVKTGWAVAGIPAVKLLTGPLFVFRESYVQLLTSQYWSFMASVLSPTQSATWFGPIAGLTSIASAVAGVSVPPLVNAFGLSGTLFGTGVTLGISLLAAWKAYSIADQHGFTPKDVQKKKKKATSPKSTTMVEPELMKASLLEKATMLFQRVPVLRALFMEILASQGLATVLNVIFMSSVTTAIPNDEERAGWLGVFYSLINVITMSLQFAILPPLMTVLEPKQVWRIVPLVSLIISVFQSLQKNPSLYLCSGALLTMKVSEYSARRMLDEMVFVPLDFESRFLGKEVIGVFGYRFGKSLMSLGMSGISSILGSGFGMQQMSILSLLVACGWMKTAWSLSNLVPTRAEAEVAYKVVKALK